MAQMMAKALEHRGENTMKEVTMFAETLLKGVEITKGTKRKGADKDPEPQGKNLIEENFHVVDDGHTVVDWTIRNLLCPVNGNPNSYWEEETWEAEVGLTHLLPLSVNPWTIQAVYTVTTMTKIMHYSCKNRSSRGTRGTRMR